MTNTQSASEMGRSLYRAIWETVGANFFDATRLVDWSSWEHRFDDQIADEESALAFADQAMASLGDTYTERMGPAVQSLASVSVQPAAQAEEKPACVMSVLRPDGIGYLRILDFDSEEVTNEVEAALAKLVGCKGLVLDVRHNSGGRMHRAIECCGLFLENGLITTVQIRDESGVTERKYYLNEEQFFCVETKPDGTETTDFYTRRPALMAGIPVVVLINRRTASAAELFVAAVVQNGVEGKVETVGSGETAAKGIGQAEFPLMEDKMTVRITRSRWLAPGGDWLGDCGQTVRNAIAPSILVPVDHGMEGFTEAVKQVRKMIEEPGADSQVA